MGARWGLTALFLSSFVAAGCGGRDTSRKHDDPPSSEPARSGPAAPADVAKPPSDAKVTDNGIKYKNVVEGSGAVHDPKAQVAIYRLGSWATSGQVLQDRPRMAFSHDLSGEDWFVVGALAKEPMRVGEIRHLWAEGPTVRPAMTHGWQDGSRPPDRMYEIELLAARAKPAIERTPPESAKTSAKKDFRYVVEPEHAPRPDDTVFIAAQVLILCVDADGKELASSWSDGLGSFDVSFDDRGSKVWPHVLRLLRDGDRIRVWGTAYLDLGSLFLHASSAKMACDIELLSSTEYHPSK